MLKHCDLMGSLRFLSPPEKLNNQFPILPDQSHFPACPRCSPRAMFKLLAEAFGLTYSDQLQPSSFWSLQFILAFWSFWEVLLKWKYLGAFFSLRIIFNSKVDFLHRGESRDFPPNYLLPKWLQCLELSWSEAGNQELGASSRVPTWLQGTKDLSHPVSFLEPKRSWIGSEAARTQTGPQWDASMADQSLKHSEDSNGHFSKQDTQEGSNRRVPTRPQHRAPRSLGRPQWRQGLVGQMECSYSAVAQPSGQNNLRVLRRVKHRVPRPGVVA